MAFLMLSPKNTITKRDFSPLFLICSSQSQSNCFSLAIGIDVKYISIEMIKDKFICFINSFKIKTIRICKACVRQTLREAKYNKKKNHNINKSIGSSFSMFCCFMWQIKCLVHPTLCQFSLQFSIFFLFH